MYTKNMRTGQIVDYIVDKSTKQTVERVDLTQFALQPNSFKLLWKGFSLPHLTPKMTN